MSARFDQWFAVQPDFFRLGHAKALSASTSVFYTYLCFVTDRRSSREFPLLDSKITEATGLSARSFTSARKALTDRGLIQCSRAPGEGYTYVMFHIATAKPYLGSPRDKVNKSSFSKGPQTPQDAHNVGDAAESEVDSDTLFKYGHNVSQSFKNKPKVEDQESEEEFLDDPFSHWDWK